MEGVRALDFQCWCGIVIHAFVCAHFNVFPKLNWPQGDERSMCEQDQQAASGIIEMPLLDIRIHWRMGEHRWEKDYKHVLWFKVECTGGQCSWEMSRDELLSYLHALGREKIDKAISDILG